MPRTARASVGGMWNHALSRGNRREAVFHKDEDYAEFVEAMVDARTRLPVDVLGYCLKPNHFHLVLRPKADGDLGRWMQWLLTAHARRYHRHYGTSGHVWQGRFKEWATSLNKTVGLWISDKQDAFVTGIVAEFPGVPHRYCDNHFLRDLAKPVLEADSHAKVQMRHTVRGLRKIEQAVLKRQNAEALTSLAQDDPTATVTVIVAPANAPAPEPDSAGTVVLDY